MITLPLDVYLEGRPQPIIGEASDVDLNSGEELTFVWSSNISGIVGEGRELDLALKEGLHLITLTVTDPQGSFNSTMVELTVLPRSDSGSKGNKVNGCIIVAIIVLIFVAVIVCAAIYFFVIMRRNDVISWEE